MERMHAEVGKRYRHYKGGEYTVLSIARHSETLEEFVVYRAEYETPDFPEGTVWARPREMFEGTVEKDSVQIPRFTLL